jgi:hypothetical protein
MSATTTTTTTTTTMSCNYSLNDEWDSDKEENVVSESSQQLADLVDISTLKSLREFVQQCEEVLQRSERHGYNQSIRRSNDIATKHYNHHQQQSRRLLHRLIVTSALGLVECVQWLLECGADPTVSLAYGRERWTALHYAAATRQVHVLAALLTATPHTILTIDTLRDNSPLHYTPLDLLSIDLEQTPRTSSRCPVCIPHQVWSWGSGSEWLLGHGDPLDRPSPKRIKALEDEHVISLTTTSRCCAALAASGTFNHTILFALSQT